MLQFLKKHDWLQPGSQPQPVIAPRPSRRTPTPSLRPRPVIARNEAIHRRLQKDMDCHGAARLAMTEGAAIAPRPFTARPAPSLHPAPSLRPRPVIARNEAIHRRSYNSMDCHGAARLAMTEGAAIAPRPFTARPAPSLHPAPSLRPRPRHCEERSNPSALMQQLDCRGLVGFEVQPAFALEARAQRVPIEARLLGYVAQGQHHALFHGLEAADVKAAVRIL